MKGHSAVATTEYFVVWESKGGRGEKFNFVAGVGEYY